MSPEVTNSKLVSMTRGAADGNSNKSQVTLRDVDFALSGTFSCEVTADAPTFSTAYVSKNLTVVSIPGSSIE
ncbi:hypothetical protein WN51_02546 [Melipona quadrifasciata]|uniref:Ig-like domain-containing protein n=1 Tax=Melipona quadrifasciata TaxID=166423 RepID=A0A0M8ZSY6_9HYME|nr:hypothetical protein WN51_02546 [Melipona quadrifasciata]